MSNSCTSDIVFFSKSGDTTDLLRFSEALRDLMDACDLEHNVSFDSLAEQHGISHLNLDGEIIFIQDFNESSDKISLKAVSTKSSACVLWNAIIPQYPLMDFVICSEDSKNHFYLNTDLTGKFLDNRYLLCSFSRLDDESILLSEQYFKPNILISEYLQDTLYLQTKADIDSYVEFFTDRKFDTVDEINKFFQVGLDEFKGKVGFVINEFNPYI